MHKLVTTALIALLLIASPLMMFGTSDSNIFSKAMAIEEDGSESDIKSFIKSNDESEGNDESSDEGNDESSNAIQQNQNNDEPQPVVDTSQPIQQIQNNEPQQQEQQQEQEQEQEQQQQQQQQQTTKQSQQGNKGLSIISQEEMQQQQYENFKKLYESVKQQHKEIEILK